jgi:transposase-like protein
MRRERQALFKGRHFEAEIIVLCVRWHLRYPLSLRQLEEIMAERNLSVAHVDLAVGAAIRTGAEPPLPPGTAEREPVMESDETYCRVAGKWTYLYRAVDPTGATIDFLTSARRHRIQPDASCRNPCGPRAIRDRG